MGVGKRARARYGARYEGFSVPPFGILRILAIVG